MVVHEDQAGTRGWRVRAAAFLPLLLLSLSLPTCGPLPTPPTPDSPSTEGQIQAAANYVVQHLEYAKDKHGVCYAVYTHPSHTVAITMVPCESVGL